MKKVNLFLIVIIIAVVFCSTVLYLINYQGAMVYFVLVTGDNASGAREAKAFQNLPTSRLINIIHSNMDFNKFPIGHAIGYFKSGRYGGAIKVFGSRIDSEAIEELTKIIRTHSIGGRNGAIYSIGQSKNKAMVPILCETLKKHTHWHTDVLIIDALVNIDDPSALQCFIDEKNKIESKDARKKAEQAIEKWSQETHNE